MENSYVAAQHNSGWGSEQGPSLQVLDNQPRQVQQPVQQGNSVWGQGTQITNIPTLDSAPEQRMVKDIAAPPSQYTAQRVIDLGSLNQKLSIPAQVEQGIDLSILTSVVKPAEQVFEDDETWEHEQLILEISHAIRQDVEELDKDEEFNDQRMQQMNTMNQLVIYKMALELARILPKAELHLHIEGTLEPALMYQIAARNNIQLSFSLEEAVSKRQNYADLQDFLDQYYDACRVLIQKQDFYDLAIDYFQKAGQDNIRYCEVFFDPQTHTQRGISFETIINGFYEAAQYAKQQYNVEARFIMCILRHLSEEDAIQTIRQAEPFKDKIWGIGLDSGEMGNPPEKFANAFRLASELGLCGPNGNNITAHGGEEGDPSYIKNALNFLNARRIDHGVRCLEDDELITELIDKKVYLTVCPGSNDCLQVLQRFFNGQMIIDQMMQKGLLIMINSDDPAFFGGYLNTNFQKVIESLSQYSEQQQREWIVELCKNSFRASFITDEEKERFISEIDQLV